MTNWTLSSTEARVSVQVGVAYGSPPELVIGLLRQAVCELPQQLSHREAIVLFSDFGDSALLFETHFWIQLRTEMDGRRARVTCGCALTSCFGKPASHWPSRSAMSIWMSPSRSR